MTGPAIAFYILASLCVVSGVMVVTRRSPIHAALFLILAFFGVAGIYVVLSAEFLAAVQVLVYAGGIMVLFLFVIMLVPLEIRAPRLPVWEVARALALAGLVAAVMIGFFWNVGTPRVAASAPLVGNIETVGMELYRRYLVPFEIASVTLLVAMIGAVVLARGKA